MDNCNLIFLSLSHWFPYHFFFGELRFPHFFLFKLLLQDPHLRTPEGMAAFLAESFPQLPLKEVRA